MTLKRLLVAASSVLALVPSSTYAQSSTTSGQLTDNSTDTTPEDARPIEALHARVEELERQLRELREQRELDAEDTRFRDQQLSVLSQLNERLTGYLDIGIFDVQGDGAGIRIDTGNRVFPEYDYVGEGWTFMGDPLSTMINARGDPAGTSTSRALATDTIGSSGALTFIVNTLSLSLFRGLSDNLSMEATVEFMPRTRRVSAVGGSYLSQLFEIPRAYVEYIAPIDSFELHIFAGKFDSVVGFEYRSQEAPNRITVTPSLICRYVCGHPVGVKARALFLDRALVLNTAITNGSHFGENFPFRNEIDVNSFKTLAGRLSYTLPIGLGIEFGVSGSYGAQDLQIDNAVRHWQIGADLSIDWNNMIVRAEFHRGNAPGKTDVDNRPCDEVPCLDYKGAFGMFAYRAKRGIMPYIRVDWRDALHRNGASFVYISSLYRATFGMRKEFGPHLIAKLEYTINQELDRVPIADNNIFTSSLVVRY